MLCRILNFINATPRCISFYTTTAHRKATDFPLVMLISEAGINLGQKNPKDIEFDSQKLRLALVSPPNAPPVCRLLPALVPTTKAKPVKKKTSTLTIKTMEIKAQIGQHDLDVKLKKCNQFLAKAYRIDFNLIFSNQTQGKLTRKGEAALGELYKTIVTALSESGAAKNRKLVQQRLTFYVDPLPTKLKSTNPVTPI